MADELRAPGQEVDASSVNQPVDSNTDGTAAQPPEASKAPVGATVYDAAGNERGNIAPGGKVASPAPKDQSRQNLSEGAFGTANTPDLVPGVQPVHPAVQKAGLLRKIAETLAGGPRMIPSIDVNTGKTTYTPQHLSKGDIGMAIAMSVLEGGLAGMQAKGPNANGEAAGRGAQAVMQQREKVDQEQEQRAQQDYARHAQVLETNMRLHNNALQAGRMDFEQNKAYVDQMRPLADKLMSDYPQAIRGHATEQELSKYHITMDSAIPFSVVKRLDPKTGEQVEINGHPQWDIDYLVVDPRFKSDDLVTKEDRELFNKLRLTGWANGDGKMPNLPQSLPVALNMAMNWHAQAGAFKLLDSNLKEYYDTLNSGGKPATNFKNIDYKTPSLKDPNIEALIDDAATKYDVPPGLVRALAIEESGGNPKAKSPKGAMGVMQLMPGTAKQLGVKDAFDPAQNIDGGVRYLKSLLDKFGGDPRRALAAYHGIGSDGITTDKEYGDSILKMVGYEQPQGDEQAAASAPKYAPVDLMDAVQKDPTLMSAITKFQAMHNRTENIGQAIAELAKTDPQAAGKMSQLFGGRDSIQNYDQVKSLQAEANKDKIKADAQLAKEEESRKQKEAEKEADYRSDAKVIAGDPDDPGSGSMDQLDKLVSQRTADRPKVMRMIREYNPNWNMANAMAKVEVWRDFTTDRGKASQQITSFNTLFDHIGSALEKSDEFRRSDSSDLLNRPWNWIAEHAKNDPKVKELQVAIEPVKNEFMTLLQNNHALTESDKESAQRLVTAATTPALFEAAMKTVAETAAFRIKETDQRYFRVFRNKDGSKGHFPGLVSDDAVRAIGKMTNPDGSNKVADILGDMDTGGSVLGSADGRGVPGKTVREALGTQQQRAAQIAQKNGGTAAKTYPGQRPGETPVVVDGQAVGFTMPGKKGMRPAGTP